MIVGQLSGPGFCLRTKSGKQYSDSSSIKFEPRSTSVSNDQWPSIHSPSLIYVGQGEDLPGSAHQTEITSPQGTKRVGSERLNVYL